MAKRVERGEGPASNLEEKETDKSREKEKGGEKKRKDETQKKKKKKKKKKTSINYKNALCPMKMP